MLKWRLGLQTKFIGLILVLLTLIFAVIAFVLIRVDTISLRKDLQDRSKAFATLATTPIGNSYVTYQNSGTYLIGKQIATFQALDPTIAKVSVINLTGDILYSTEPNAPSIPTKDASSFDPIYKYTNGTISQIIFPYFGQNGVHSYAIVYNISSTEINKAVRSLAQSILIDSIVGLVISAAIISFLVNRWFLLPIKRVRNQAMLIAAGNYGEVIKQGRKDEIGDLANSVNQMADSLKADIQKLKEVDEIKSEFMMIASHNLRTPLTIIDGYVSIAKSWSLSNELRSMLESIEANSQRLGMFAEDLLTMSSIEAGKSIFVMEHTTVQKMLSHMVEEFTTLANEKQRHFTANITHEVIEFTASPAHLRSAIWNLLDNSLKFTKPNSGEITLSIQRVGSDLEISVSDNGLGIPTEEMGKLFTKFHRGTSTLTYDYEGTGIGLYITKQIVTAHHGSVAVDSTQDKGTTFIMTIPLQLPSNPSQQSTTQSDSEPAK
jgi:signal transduction histidine kinase